MTNIKSRLSAIILLGAMSTASLPAWGGDGVEINHLGVNNTLVRVTGGGNYLMLPVQETIYL